MSELHSQTCSVVVGATTDALQVQAKALAQRLQLPFDMSPHDGDLLLLLTPEGLKLKDRHAKQEAPIWVDFASGKLQQRSQEAGAAKQTLAKAVGVKPGVRPTIIDATAGLGRDGFVLALLGCKMTLLERHPIVAALLIDGLARGEQNPQIADVIANIKFVPTQAVNYLKGLAESEKPDVVYLDPMFPHRQKSALIKKEMRLFQTLVGVDDDVGALLDVALEVARKRVVVKRPSKGEGVAGKEPQLVLSGKSTRYDIYFIHP